MISKCVTSQFHPNLYRSIRPGFQADSDGTLYFSGRPWAYWVVDDLALQVKEQVFGKTTKYKNGETIKVTEKGVFFSNGEEEHKVDEPFYARHKKQLGKGTTLHLGVDARALQCYKRALEKLQPKVLASEEFSKKNAPQIVEMLHEIHKEMYVYGKSGGELRKEPGFTFPMGGQPPFKELKKLSTEEEKIQLLKKRGAIFYTDPKELPKMMLILAEKLKSIVSQILQGKADAVDAAADFAYDFTSIHPYNECNGRMARAISNALLHLGGQKGVHYQGRDPYVTAISKGKGAFRTYFRKVVDWNRKNSLFEKKAQS